MAIIRFQDKPAAERIHDDGGLDAAAAEAAQGFLERQPKQTHFGDLVPHGGAVASRFAHVFLALLELILVGHEAVHAVFQQALVFGKVEIHGTSSLTFCAAVTPAARISLAPHMTRGKRRHANPARISHEPHGTSCARGRHHIPLVTAPVSPWR